MRIFVARQLKVGTEFRIVVQKQFFANVCKTYFLRRTSYDVLIEILLGSVGESQTGPEPVLRNFAR